MSTFTPTLQLHQVPAGRRLDFSTQPGRFAYVYRRSDYGGWQCIARNACSPSFDNSFAAAGSVVEYMVCHCDASGNITATTPIVQVQLVGATLLANHSITSHAERATT
ncbi:hypothetical protein [Hymenobacter sp. GOD-10R]|uniref:hypothetical protein n=1 Tax=Hymenobacter sp. GOD-10R TaxID=3093922 RepID=UPI002D78F7CC|nr:hypothetical protein [Hymenobacter sp. GOD-10R]WRQ30337.1 hypothetical protein SD425_08700 [Hymenobacter sp. GOD-10R]